MRQKEDDLNMAELLRERIMRLNSTQLNSTFKSTALIYSGVYEMPFPVINGKGIFCFAGENDRSPLIKIKYNTKEETE